MDRSDKVATFYSPFGTASLHCIKSELSIEPKACEQSLYTSLDKKCSVFTDYELDTYYLQDGGQWYGLAAFCFSGQTRMHFRDYCIQDIRVSSRPAGTYRGEYQSLIRQLENTSERGKSRVVLSRIRALFEDEIIKSVILPLLPCSDSFEIIGTWQHQEKLFELGFRAASNAYKRGG